MKNFLMMVIAASGLLLATSSEAKAQSWNSGRNSGFGVSLNFGSPQGYANRGNLRHSGHLHNSGFQQSQRYGHNGGYTSGYNGHYNPPVQSFQPYRVTNRYSGNYNYSNQYLPTRQFSQPRNYGYGGCGY